MTLHSPGTETLALFSVRSVTLQGSTLDRSRDPGEAPGAHPHCSPTLPSAQQGHMAGARLLTWLGPRGQQPIRCPRAGPVS